MWLDLIQELLVPSKCHSRNYPSTLAITRIYFVATRETFTTVRAILIAVMENSAEVRTTTTIIGATLATVVVNLAVADVVCSPILTNYFLARSTSIVAGKIFTVARLALQQQGQPR